MRRVPFLMIFAGLVLSSSAIADITDIRFSLHRKPEYLGDPPELCDRPATQEEEPNYSPNYDNIPCSQYTVTAPVPGKSQVYVVISRDTTGVSGASFGIDYDGRHNLPLSSRGIDPVWTAWTLCSEGLQFPNNGGLGEFPDPKGGIRLSWNGCATDQVAGKVHAVAGTFYIYAYSEDVLRLTPNNNLESGIPELSVTDCVLNETFLTPILMTPEEVVRALGRVHFGGNGSQGYTPCGVTAVQPTTWGKIKTMYRK